MPIEKSVVAVLAEGKIEPVGTGFLVSPFHVLTCAHVVGEALGDHYEDRMIAKDPGKPSGSFSVRFTACDRPETVAVKSVEQWSRYYDRAELAQLDDASVFMTRDLALLRLDQQAPAEAKPVRFWVPRDPQDISVKIGRKTLTAYGYPRIGGDVLNPLKFQYEARSDGNEFLVSQVDEDYDPEELGGLSGAPLVLNEYDLVIGLALEVGYGRNMMVAKPARHLKSFWNKIRLVCHGCELSDTRKIPPNRLLDINRDEQINVIAEAAQAASESGTRIMLATVMGDTDNRVCEWIDHIVGEKLQFMLDDILPEWVEPIKPILLHAPRFNTEAAFKKVLVNLARQLGIATLNDFVTEVTHALNGDKTSSGTQIDPPPYFIFQLSASAISDVDMEVLTRLIRFWGEVANNQLQRTQLVFIALISRNLDESQTVVGNVVNKVRHIAAEYEALQVTEPLPGASNEDTKKWLEEFKDRGEEDWDLDAKTAAQIQGVVDDIFNYEFKEKNPTLRAFQAELEKLELCRKRQEE